MEINAGVVNGKYQLGKLPSYVGMQARMMELEQKESEVFMQALRGLNGFADGLAKLLDELNASELSQ